MKFKVNQSTLNKAHVIEITNVCTVAFMKVRSSSFFDVERRNKKQNGGNAFIKALANRFFLTLKSSSWFHKVVHRRSSVK